MCSSYKSETRRLFILAVFTCASLFVAVPTFAQNESGIRSLNQTRIQGLGAWYDSSTAIFQKRYPIIRSIPPLSTAMPYDVLLSYIHTDSLVRFAGSWDVEARIRTWNAPNDTLLGMASYLYRMQDFNPIIFSQYQAENGLGNGRRYSALLSSIVVETAEKYYQVLPDSINAALYSLLHPDYILRIHVLAIDSMFNKNSSFGGYRYRVTAEVLDTLKGQVFTTITTSQVSAKARARMLSTSNPVMQFQYSPRVYSNSSGVSEPFPFPLRDSAFMNAAGGFRMQVGQEAVAFLTHVNWKVDSLYDYFDLDVDPRASYNALPIVNGQVRDVNHTWTANTLMKYADWKQRFFLLRSNLLSGVYRFGG